VGHLEYVLILDQKGGMSYNNHSFQGVAIGSFIFPQQGFQGFFTARPGMGNYFRMDKPAAQYDSPFCGDRMFRVPNIISAPLP